MQYDGNLVLYKDNQPVWASGTNGSGPEAVAEFQGDGNLVVYWRRFALWNSGTAGGGARLILTDDGNLLIVRGFTVVWQTYTGDPRRRAPIPARTRRTATTGTDGATEGGLQPGHLQPNSRSGYA
jgi:hypothetical protein